MSTPWTVISDIDQFRLDDRRRGEVTFTITNTGDRPDRAMFEIVTDPAAQAWFTVEEPQRFIPGGGSVRYKVSADLPIGAPAGRYQIQGRVYSLDSVPEETSVLSGRVVVELAGAAPQPKRRPLWLIIGVAAVAAAVVVGTVVVVVVVATAGSGEDERNLSSTVVVPDVTRLPEDRAAVILERAGLKARFKHRHVSATVPNTQSFQPGLAVARGTVIEVVFAVRLSPPNITAPAAPYTILPPVPGDPIAARWVETASLLQVAWTQPEPWVRSWRVLILDNVCAQKNDDRVVNYDTYLSPDLNLAVNTPSFTTVRYFASVSGVRPRSCGDEFVRVAAVDDFGNIGPFSVARQYGLATR